MQGATVPELKILNTLPSAGCMRQATGTNCQACGVDFQPIRTIHSRMSIGFGAVPVL